MDQSFEEVHVAAEFDLPALQALFEELDFIGISAYIAMPSPDISVGKVPQYSL